MITLYGIPNCDSVRKTKKLLESLTISYREVNLKKNPLSQEQIESFARKVGIEELLNSKGMTYRRLNLKEQTLSNKEKIQWMVKEQMLMRRPILEKGNQVMVGFNEEKIKQFVA